LLLPWLPMMIQFVCQLIDELQLVRDWSCGTSLVLFLMSVIKPSDSSIPMLFCEAWDGCVRRFHYCHDLFFETQATLCSNLRFR
jgi:hypothetical protein